MRRVGIYTQNFRFYHELLNILKFWKIPCVSLTDPDKVPYDVPVILSSSDDQNTDHAQIKRADPMAAVRGGIPFLLGKAQFTMFVIGIDPGPKPGLAVLGDGILLEAFETVNISACVRSVELLYKSYVSREKLIRIGDGDAPNRDRILRELKPMEARIEIVDESNTSQPHQVHDNAVSAARIARGPMHAFPANIAGYRRRQVLEREFVTLRKAIALPG